MLFLLVNPLILLAMTRIPTTVKTVSAPGKAKWKSELGYYSSDDFFTLLTTFLQSGSVPNATAPIPPYRSFSRVYEFLVDQLDLSEKRKEAANNLSHEEKWKLLSNISRESSLNLLV